jgi:hypothetical protein
MKILYAGELRAGTSCLYRKLALERLGHEIVEFDPTEYRYNNKFGHWLSYRVAAGPKASQMNRDLLRLAERERPELFWADKLLLLTPGTLQRLRALGITTVSYMIDNAFGPRRDPGWRMYVKAVPSFDLHVTQRDVSVRDYLARGARAVMKVQTAYEPTIHFAPETAWTDAQRTREVSFIGTPYDDRAQVLTQVAEAGLPVVISGNPRQWRKVLSGDSYAKLFCCGELYEQEYREARINLSFITKANQDEVAHKSFEIAACGGFLMAERSNGHLAKFREDEEAVFFSSTEEFIGKIRRYLPDEAERTRIAAAGRARALRDGYCNDVQVLKIVERAQEIARESEAHGG